MKYELTAKRIRLAMDRMNLSQQELANRCAIGKSSISHYVNGTNEPGNKAAYILAQVLNVNPAWLMGFDAPMEPGMPKPEEPSNSAEAMILYQRYMEAAPNIRAAVQALLGSDEHDS